MTRRRAQSILEYVIILSAITAAVIAAATNVIRPAVTTMMTDSGNVITTKTAEFRADIGN